MYKKKLFQYGVKRFLPYKKGVLSKRGRGVCSGSGVNNNLDNYLLSLVKGVKSLSIPKVSKHKKRGGALKYKLR